MANVNASALERLQESDCPQRPTLCLDRCGQCRSEDFLVVDGELRDGASHRSLLADAESDGEGDSR